MDGREGDRETGAEVGAGHLRSPFGGSVRDETLEGGVTAAYRGWSRDRSGAHGGRRERGTQGDRG